MLNLQACVDINADGATIQLEMSSTVTLEEQYRRASAFCRNTSVAMRTSIFSRLLFTDLDPLWLCSSAPHFSAKAGVCAVQDARTIHSGTKVALRFLRCIMLPICVYRRIWKGSSYFATPTLIEDGRTGGIVECHPHTILNLKMAHSLSNAILDTSYTSDHAFPPGTGGFRSPLLTVRRHHCHIPRLLPLFRHAHFT